MRDEPKDVRVEEGEVESIKDMLVQMPWEQGAYVSSGSWAGRVAASLFFSIQPMATTASSPLVRERGETMEVERDGRSWRRRDER
ncbi:hypothetical protein ACE6H2_019668 [Prunus campanulata]